MRSSDLYLYTVSILWILWFCYIGGFFLWLSSTYTRLRHTLSTLALPKSPKPVDMEKRTALRAVWSAKNRLPGAWVEEGEPGTQDEGEDRSVIVEDGFVLVEKAS